MDSNATKKVLSHIPFSSEGTVLWKIVSAGFAVVVATAFVVLGIKGVLFSLMALVFVLLVAAIMWRPWIGIAAIALTLPFERFGSIELSGFTLRISQVLLLVTLCVAGIQMLRNKLKIRFSGTHIPLLIFFLGALLSFPQSVNVFRSVTSFGFMLFTMSMVVLIPSIVRTKEQLLWIIKALLFGAIVTSCFGMFQFAGDLAGLPQEVTGLRDLYTKEVFGFPRVQSTALEPLYFANYLLLPIAIALVVLLRRIKPLFALSAVLLPIALPVFVLTLSRGAYIAGLILLLLLGVWQFRRIVKPEYIFLSICLGILTFVGVTYALSLTGEEDVSVSAFTAQATGIFTGASFADRASTTTQAFELIRNHPLGVGPGNFGPAIADHPLVEPEGGWLIVNNIYLEVLAEEGIFGLIGLLSFVSFVLYAVIKKQQQVQGLQKSLLMAFFAALVAIGVQYVTFSIVYIMHIWFALGIAIVLATSNNASTWTPRS